MGGNQEGAQKTRAKNLAKDLDYYKKLGAKGGAAPHKDGTGFGSTKVGKDGLTGHERSLKLAQERKQHDTPQS